MVSFVFLRVLMFPETLFNIKFNITKTVFNLFIGKKVKNNFLICTVIIRNLYLKNNKTLEV